MITIIITIKVVNRKISWKIKVLISVTIHFFFPAFFRKEITNKVATTIIRPLPINVIALNPSFVIVFPKTKRRMTAPTNKAIF